MEGIPNLEKVDYLTMTSEQLQADPVALAVLQKKALEYLQTADREWFDKNFTGEVTSEGFLVERNGDAFMTPLQNIGGGRAFTRVMDEARKELVGGNLSDESVESSVPPALLEYEKLHAELWGRDPAGFIKELQECADKLLVQDPQFKEILDEGMAILDNDGFSHDTHKKAWAFIHALSRRGEDFNLKVD